MVLFNEKTIKTYKRNRLLGRQLLGKAPYIRKNNRFALLPVTLSATLPKYTTQTET
jgi:hypothetical protein